MARVYGKTSDELRLRLLDSHSILPEAMTAPSFPISTASRKKTTERNDTQSTGSTSASESAASWPSPPAASSGLMSFLTGFGKKGKKHKKKRNEKKRAGAKDEAQKQTFTAERSSQTREPLTDNLPALLQCKFTYFIMYSYDVTILNKVVCSNFIEAENILISFTFKFI